MHDHVQLGRSMGNLESWYGRLPDGCGSSKGRHQEHRPDCHGWCAGNLRTYCFCHHHTIHFSTWSWWIQYLQCLQWIHSRKLKPFDGACQFHRAFSSLIILSVTCIHPLYPLNDLACCWSVLWLIMPCCWRNNWCYWRRGSQSVWTQGGTRKEVVLG